MEVFPSEPISFDLQSDSAAVYDVLQTAVFSVDEERLFENTGAVPQKQRLFLNPRDGKVSAHVDISFEFDAANNAKAFVGFANVRVTAPNPESAPGGFILDLSVYETRNIGLMYPPSNDVREIAADSVRLHFAPTFLVVEEDYFTDRKAGIGAMQAAMDHVSQRFSESKARLGPGEPIEQVEHVARYQQWLVDAYAELAGRAPAEMKALEETYAVPVANRV
jgi:hypothetical protein